MREMCLLGRHEVETLLHERLPAFSVDAVVGMASAEEQTLHAAEVGGFMNPTTFHLSGLPDGGIADIWDSIILMPETLPSIARLVLCHQK